MTSATIRTVEQLKFAFHSAIGKAHTKEDLVSLAANVVLGDMDSVISNSWSALSDMGMSKAQFAKVKRQVKKRL